MKSAIFLLAGLLPVVLSLHTGDYTYSATLYDQGDDSYELYWSFDRDAETISFAVEVSTTGWVGFGLSPDGGMVNSDVVLAGLTTTEMPSSM